MKKRNSAIELLRFVFCVMIINYHFYSHCLRYTEVNKFFTRGYLGDEFFFVVTGVFLAESAMRNTKDPLTYAVQGIINRIKKVSFPYYFTWLCCFVFKSALVLYSQSGGVKDVFKNLINSIYELLFIDMFGFTSGYYSNVVAWFFSALLIVTFVISPWISKYKKVYVLYYAPIFSAICYGILSLNYDYMHSPHVLVPNTFILKGIVRAFAAINLGVFIYGLSMEDRIKRIHNKFLTFVILLVMIHIYTIYPFKSNYEETSIQWDYVITLLIGIVVLYSLIIFCDNSKQSAIMNRLGNLSYYAFFGQAIFYSFDIVIYSPNREISLLLKYIITIIMVSLFTFILYFLDNHRNKNVRIRK